jgi:hypothetical protein
MVFNATFNNISVISWLSVLLVEETGVPGENHRPLLQVTDKPWISILPGQADVKIIILKAATILCHM